MNVYSLLQASATDPVSPNILLNVTLADLHQLVVDTIDATREKLLSIYMKSEEDRLLTKKEVCSQLGIGETSVWNLTKRSGYCQAVYPSVSQGLGFLSQHSPATWHNCQGKGR